VEEEGEVGPAYTGPNCPRYPQHRDTIMPHEEFYASEATPTAAADCTIDMRWIDIARAACQVGALAKDLQQRKAA
jgi:hypothetical protein